MMPANCALRWTCGNALWPAKPYRNRGLAIVFGGLVGSAMLRQLFDRFEWAACVGGVAAALAVAALLTARRVYASVRRVSGMTKKIIRRPNAATPARPMKATLEPSLSLI
jgi:hypothetical protein